MIFESKNTADKESHTKILKKNRYSNDNVITTSLDDWGHGNLLHKPEFTDKGKTYNVVSIRNYRTKTNNNNLNNLILIILTIITTSHIQYPISPAYLKFSLQIENLKNVGYKIGFVTTNWSNEKIAIIEQIGNSRKVTEFPHFLIMRW